MTTSTMGPTWIIITILSTFLTSQTRAFLVPTISLHNGTENIFDNPLKSFLSPFLDGRAPSTNGYVWRDFYEIHQFENAPTVNGVNRRDDYENAVHSSILHCMALLSTAQLVIDQQITSGSSQLPTNPSLRRYGPSGLPGAIWLPIAQHFVRRWLDVLGWAPLDGANTRAQCLPQIPKPQFWYNDPPAAALAPGSGCASNSRKVAYYFFGSNGYKNGVVFCPLFFEEYKSLDALDPSQFGPAIELGKTSPFDQPTFFTAKILLHELMHYDDVYGDFFKPSFGPNDAGGPISDIRLIDNYGDTFVAYGAFLAVQANNLNWPWVTAERNPTIIPPDCRNTLFNADNWVYMMREIYLQKKYNLPDWQNPPENRQYGIKIPPSAPPPRPRSQPALVKAVRATAATESSSMTTIDIAWNEVPVTRVPHGTGSFGIPTYGPECPLCHARSSSVSAK